MAGRRVLAMVLAAAALALATPRPARGQWIPNGTTIRATPSNDETPRGLAPDGFGGALVVWAENTLNFDGYVRMQRVTAAGSFAPGWTVDGRVLLHTNRPSSVDAVVPDGVGGLYVLAHYYTPSELVQLLRFDSAAGVPSGWPTGGYSFDAGYCEQCSNSFYLGTVVGDPLGGCHLAIGTSTHHQYEPPTSWLGITQFDASGAVSQGWSQPGTNCVTWPLLGSDGSGGVVGFLQNTCSGQREFFAWPANGVATSVPMDPASYPYSSIARDVNNGLWLVGHQASSTGEVLVQQIAANGSPLPGWESGLPLPGPEGARTAIPDATGGMYFLWHEPGPIVRCIRMQADGSFAPSWDPTGEIITPGPSHAETYEASADGEGGVFISWTDASGAAVSGAAIFASRMSSDGSIAPEFAPAGRTIVSGVSVITNMRLATTSPGAAIVCWADNRSGNSDIYAQRLPLDQVTSALASLVRSDATPGRVSLAWRVGSEVASATLQRSVEPGEWTDFAELIPDGLGEVAFEDRGLLAGSRIGYRLDLGGGTAGEVWVTIPGGALALAGFSPNPSTNGAQLAFTLASDEPATIEVLDVSGRRVFQRDLGGLGPGAHRTELPAGTRLSPGVYVIRLRQGGAVVTARGVVSR